MKRKLSDLRSGDGAPLSGSRECPFLDTINRRVLNFDFDRLCSVSLLRTNVYACLVCGKYFQGRGDGTHAQTHALQAQHSVFMNLENGAIYCLPDNYEVADPSLEDIKYSLRPTFAKEDVEQVGRVQVVAKDIFGQVFRPGFCPMDELTGASFVNATVRALAHAPPLREFFLDANNYEPSTCKLVHLFGQLVCKLWSARKLKASVSAHELIQEVSNASGKRFRLGFQSDCVDFLKWFLNALHRGLGGTHKRGSSIIYQCFQGKVQVTTARMNNGPDKDTTAPAKETRVVDSLLLSLDLPESPLFKDNKDGKSLIPQITMDDAFEKFNGVKAFDSVREDVVERRTYKIVQLPPYLLIHLNRFTKTQWGAEKNHTIVNLPVTTLDLKDFVEQQVAQSKKGIKKTKKNRCLVPTLPSVSSTKYSLLANICHKTTKEETGQHTNAIQNGDYLVHVLNKPEKKWYELQDLYVTETMPQLISLSQSYLAIYENF
mmetsp:Transcript_1473/g.2241  ORF Transcript_1473/g.2241 Transcript_1473/m.2241 type:complete len:488 (+) Transcript_1473:3309-4772(+)